MIGPYSTEPAHIRVQPDGTVDVYLGSGSHGQGLETTTAQLVSEFLGVAFDDVTVHQGDTSETPYAFGTGGSRSGPILGAAIQGAAQELRGRRWPTIAAHLLEASPDDIDIVDGVASVRGTPHAIAHRRRDRPRRVPRARRACRPGMEPGLEVLKRYKSDLPFVYSNACHICTVEIDPHTGAVQLLRYVVSEDCGVMINPSVVEGQIAGGAVQGIGGALLEDFVYDEQGNPLTTTFLDYLLPTAADVPDDRVRPHRDAGLDARSLQGRRRRRRHRRAGRGGQRGERRARAGRRPRRRPRRSHRRASSRRSRRSAADR